MESRRKAAKRLRIEQPTLEASAAATVRRFVAECEEAIVLVGLSDPHGVPRSGFLRPTISHMRRSGPRFIPYPVTIFVAHRLPGVLWRLLRRPFGPAGIPRAQACRQHGIACVMVRGVNGLSRAAAMKRFARSGS